MKTTITIDPKPFKAQAAKVKKILETLEREVGILRSSAMIIAIEEREEPAPWGITRKEGKYGTLTTIERGVGEPLTVANNNGTPTGATLKTYKNRYDAALAKARGLLALGKKLKPARRKKNGEVISYSVDGVRIRAAHLK